MMCLTIIFKYILKYGIFKVSIYLHVSTILQYNYATNYKLHYGILPMLPWIQAYNPSAQEAVQF